MREEGWKTILCEGGPRILGELLAARLVDELFLTVSPVLTGRPPGALALVEAVRLPHGASVGAKLLSLRASSAPALHAVCDRLAGGVTFSNPMLDACGPSL